MSGIRTRLSNLAGPSAHERPATVVLALVVVASSAILGIAATRLWLQTMENTKIDRLAAGDDVPVAETSGSRLLFARAVFLLERDRIDEAQALVSRIAETGESDLAGAALYDLANARLRLALHHLESNEIDPAIPQVRLAKDAYRRALVLDPGFWDAKYNLDIAMRLVRDFPQLGSEAEEPPADAKKRPWTDLPGLPKGLP